MTTSSFKVESGIQLLARLIKKPTIENFYPMLFESGPKHGEVIELFSDDRLTNLLMDITCTALLPMCVGGVETGVLIFNCSGHFNYNNLMSCMLEKIKSNLNQVPKSTADHNNDEKKNELLQMALKSLSVVEIYDITQFYTTIFNLENTLLEHSNITLVIFDTISAFYWLEQDLKIVKMDTYLKKILYKIQKVTKEYKIIILYTRPEYFSSSKNVIDNLEPCCEYPTLERINYRIQVSYCKDAIYKADIRTFEKYRSKLFIIAGNQIKWI